MQLEEDRTLSAVPLPLDQGRRYAFLVSLDGPEFGQVFQLETGRELILGRWPGADVTLHDDGVSRRHARLLVGPDGATLTDLASQNGTWVDGQRVQSAVLADGARLTLGAHTTLKFILADAQEARYQLQLAEAPRLDPVTGLPTQRVLKERLEAELSAAHRRSRPVSLVAIGIDDLQGLIHRHGRRLHDEVLRMLAFVLQATLRKEDEAATFRGGRLFVLARDADAMGVQRLAVRIRQAVERSGFVVDATEHGITVGIGVASLATVPGVGQGEVGLQLVEAAGKALDEAQRRGRNQMVVLGLAPGAR